MNSVNNNVKETVKEYIRVCGIDDASINHPYTVTDRNDVDIEIRNSYVSTTEEINEQNILIEFKENGSSEVEILNLWAFAETYNFGVDCPNCGHLYYHPKKVEKVENEDGYDDIDYIGLYDCYGGGCRVSRFGTRMI